MTIAATRDRSGFDDTYQQTLTVGVRIPFGAGARHNARTAAARADVLELRAQRAVEHSRLAAERETAAARTAATRTQLVAANRRAELARESRGFFEKSS